MPHSRLALSLAGLPLALVAACTSAPFEATETNDVSVKAPGLARVLVESHNGGITYTGGDVTEFQIQTERKVHGLTQADADANLSLVQLGVDTVNGELHLYLKAAAELPSYAQPSIAFRITGPRNVGFRAVTHNGAIQVTGIEGAFNGESHNGAITAAVASHDVTAISHNGALTLELSATGAVQGSAETHNGPVEVAFAPGCSATVEADTNNGRLVLANPTAKATIENPIQVRIGDGAGKLKVTTHNGSITIR